MSAAQVRKQLIEKYGYRKDVLSTSERCWWILDNWYKILLSKWGMKRSLDLAA
ncbi:MAG: hypothetical protein RM338_16975 [Nostoc sp. DedQUE12a]|nr:hypothetical protein [Nostoc sp. DedQUE12a]